MRNLAEHKDYISLIEESEVHSVTYGINKASILQQLDNVDVTNCLPFDIMHTVYEGVGVYLLLHYLIDTRKWLSLTELNHLPLLNMIPCSPDYSYGYFKGTGTKCAQWQL